MRKILVLVVLILASLTSCDRGKKVLTTKTVAEYIEAMEIKIDSMDIGQYRPNFFRSDRVRIKKYITEGSDLRVNDILEEIHDDGYEPAPLNQVLAYIAKFPDREDSKFNDKYDILVLGSKYEDKDGYIHIPLIIYGLRDMALGYTISEMVVDGDSNYIKVKHYYLVILASKKY